MWRATNAALLPRHRHPTPWHDYVDAKGHGVRPLSTAEHLERMAGLCTVHVYDEARATAKDFSCKAETLLSSMR